MAAAQRPNETKEHHFLVDYLSLNLLSSGTAAQNRPLSYLAAAIHPLRFILIS